MREGDVVVIDLSKDAKFVEYARNRPLFVRPFWHGKIGEVRRVGRIGSPSAVLISVSYTTVGTYRHAESKWFSRSFLTVIGDVR